MALQGIARAEPRRKAVLKPYFLTFHGSVETLATPERRCSIHGVHHLKIFRNICIALGLVHAVMMTFYALGPELSPLMVSIVDAPIANLTANLASEALAFGIPIVVCSILYPTIIYLMGKLIHRIWKWWQSNHRKSRTSQCT